MSFQCFNCLASFTTKDGLKQHLNVLSPSCKTSKTSPSTLGYFECSNCKAIFNTKNALNNHFNVLSPSCKSNSHEINQRPAQQISPRPSSGARQIVPRSFPGAQQMVVRSFSGAQSQVGKPLASDHIFTNLSNIATFEETKSIIKTVIFTQPVTEKVSRNVDILFLLDMSGSMSSSSKALEVENQLILLLNGTEIQNDDYVQIVGFDHNHKELLKSTKKKNINRNMITQLGIRRLEGFGGSTQIYDALTSCIENRNRFIAEKKKKNASFKPKPFVLLLLTDGCDDTGNPSEAVINLVRNPKIPDFHIQLIGLGEGSFSAMQMLSNNCKHVKFDIVRPGAGQSVSGAIESIFRQHFLKTVKSARVTIVEEKIERKLVSGMESIAATSTRSMRITDGTSGSMGVCSYCHSSFRDLRNHLKENPTHKLKQSFKREF